MGQKMLNNNLSSGKSSATPIAKRPGLMSAKVLLPQPNKVTPPRPTPKHQAFFHLLQLLLLPTSVT